MYLNEDFNCWLTGLIEGDGTIITPKNKRDSKNRLLYPIIRIAFHPKDKPLARKIVEILGYGNVTCNGQVIILSVSAKMNILDLINRLNGNMRTPKIYRLHKMIDWFNEKHDGCCKRKKILKLDIDESSIDSNAWLSGMSDADSNFNVIITKRKNNNIKVSTQWRLKFNQKTYHGRDQCYWANVISCWLDVTLYSRSRIIKDKMYSSFIITAHNIKSKNLLIDYFNKYPLKSSKFLDYKDWYCCYEPLTKNLDIIKKHKSNMNKNRTDFNWDHLNKN